MNVKSNVWLAVALMAVFALTRWPGLLPNNFSAAYALAFCCGVFLPRRLAWWLPMATLLVTNVLLNRFHYHVPMFNGYMIVTLGAFAVIVWLGRQFKPDTSAWKLIGGGLLGAILFYLVSNTAAWVYEPTEPYPRTLGGWLKALTVGTSPWPETWKFFRNTLLSSGLFTGLFVAAMRWSAKAESAQEKEAEEPADSPAPAQEEEPAS